MKTIFTILLSLTLISPAFASDDVYPKAPSSSEIVKLNKATVAADIITQINLGKTKAEAIGPVLNGSDDVQTFNETWSDVISEGRAFRAVNPAVYENETDYKAALTDESVYLDVDTWVSGLYTEKQVANFTELKAKFMEQ